MKTAKASKGISDINGREREAKSRAETRLMWIPGAKPVNVPARIPKMRAKM